MARSYDARSVALTIGVTFKWLDNLLSHHDLPGVTGGRQGVQRRVSHDGLLAIEVTRLLASELGVPLHRAAQLARSAVAESASGEGGTVFRVATGGGITLELPAREIEARLREQLLVAAESVPTIRRGRPPATR